MKAFRREIAPWLAVALLAALIAVVVVVAEPQIDQRFAEWVPRPQPVEGPCPLANQIFNESGQMMCARAPKSGKLYPD